MPYVIAIDIGGTFTDLVACDVETGAVAYTKSPTTYGQLGDAIFDCIRKAALDARDANFVKHGTTLVINALLQRTGAKTALLTTKGFRDLLEIGRGNRTQPFNLRFRREPPLVPRELRFEIEERVEGSGRVRTPLAIAELGRSRRDPAVAARSRRWRSVSSTRISTPDTRAGCRSRAAPAAAGRVRHHRHRTDPRVARVRAHRDRGGQRLCRSAGQPIHRRVRSPVCAAAASRARCC